MKCSTCDMTLEPVFELAENQATEQFDNVLILRSEGGYGMFTDNYEGDDPVFYLCHECAHLFCRIFDPDKKLINPYNTHSHRDETVSPSHEGWDRASREDRARKRSED